MRPPRSVLAIAAILALPVVSSAQIQVMTSGGFAAPLQEILPQFEKATGLKVATTRGQSQGNGPNAIGAQLRRGVRADVVIMSREGLDVLIAEGRIAAGTAVDLARTPLGVSVRSGAPKPDISTLDAFKQTLLRAESITFPDSTTGIYMTTRMFPRLGIASEIAAKTTNKGIAAVARGESELAIQPLSELLGVPGVDFVGPIPASIQFSSVFSAAATTGAAAAKANEEAVKRLIAFLTSETARAAMEKHGMELLRTRRTWTPAVQ